MKIAFILPGIGKKKKEKYLKSWLMEPLTIAVLKSLTPDKYETIFYDDRVEEINYETDADIISITVETYTAKRAYYISEQFKRRGKIIIMGGYHATLMTEEVKEYADAVVVGNADMIWRTILEDAVTGRLQKVYNGQACIGYIKPDRSIYQDKLKKYLAISLVEVGRGCTHKCEFCSVSKYYNARYIHRKVEDIIDEIKASRNKLCFLVDDSLFSDSKFAKELFAELVKLKKIWTTQITLDVAKDEEILRLMKESGCAMVLIGFESIKENNLKQMNKEWTARLGERDELIEKIHKNGISIYASFVFGFDYDDEKSFMDTLEFCNKHKFYVAAFNHLLSFPNTITYDKLRDENRLLHSKWWVQEGYTFGSISFQPKLIEAEELMRFCKIYKNKFYTFKSIFIRGMEFFKRTKNPILNLLYWYQNILFHFEVDRRFGMPIGENLDEKIK